MMQPTDAFPEGEWDFSNIFAMEGLDFSAKLLGQLSLPLGHDEEQHLTVPLAFCPNLEGNIVSMGGFDDSPFFSWKTEQESNFNLVSHEVSNSNKCSSSIILPVSSTQETYFFSDFNHVPATNGSTMSMDISTMDGKSDSSLFPVFPDEFVMAENACNNEDISSNKLLDLDGVPTINVLAKELQLKRKFDSPERIANTQKKSRVTKEAQKSKKKQRVNNSNNGNDEEMSNGGPVHGNTTTSYCSEDDNVSQGSNGGASSDSKVYETLDSSGKTRAGRGSATDPQSLYARRRRERINERLRILQNLVPSGTKVDISTMLEEAVHYVKFLQLQIKLLSSDDLWMFAPLAYNGIDIGLGQNISMLL